MAGRKADFETWELLWEGIGGLAASLARNKAHHVNSASLRQQAWKMVQEYFREVKPALHRLGVSAATLAELDSDMQVLIGLSAGRNTKNAYQNLVRAIKARRKEIETGLEFLIGAEVPTPRFQVGRVEESILTTLDTMLPAAAASYRQVLVDVQDGGRLSYRGTAAELREVVREVLDHLAPDDDVTTASGFKLEAGQKGPTMKQKVRFILRARKVGDSARETAEGSAQHVDESVASVGRAVYTRGSTAVHTARPREEVLNYKGYADALLGELLAIHKAADPATVSTEEKNVYLEFIANSRAEQLRKAGLPVRFPRLPKMGSLKDMA
jgi:Predicted pPIWI-associating nuclease